MAFNYNGVLSSNFFLEGSYSKRKFTFENSGGRYQDNVQGTVIRHDPETRGPGDPPGPRELSS